ncbi:hypothetical protein [Mucilaginibacter ginsenosidivorax]|uniref:Uncharacterized protein n=1 Tax=Mucilaginibacter ginsenosidivorax TaxID=862126 RepID=A0A5B8W4D6_9SPHI|nr:hypothetical protein [Mucilaginibacter ginsenosidivorax]QEC78694.1 hypothetical protein FSB76_23100 [Mucilaginibacter ginsenosidivorax]
MQAVTKADIDRPINGMSFMILNTFIWTTIAVVSYRNTYLSLAEGIFALGIIILLYNFFVFKNFRKELPDESAIGDDEKKRGKGFMLIFAIEGLAILLAKNILVNIKMDYLFISSIALIVGLHFFPLAKVFRRKFDYFMGTWTTLVAILGMTFILKTNADRNLINAVVAMCCAISTSFYGIKMTMEGRRLLSLKKEAI